MTPRSRLVISPAVPPCAVSMRLTRHNCRHGLVSASKAYRLSFEVATNNTLWGAPPIERLPTHSGCAYTAASTVQENSLPNDVVLTLADVRAYSLVLVPSRAASLW